MKTLRGLIGLGCLLWLGCEQAPSSLEAAGEPGADAQVPSKPVQEVDYARFGFPPVDRAWTRDDYVAAQAAWAKLVETQVDAVPRAQGPGAALFARLSSQESHAQAISGCAGAQGALDITAAIKTMVKGYAQLSLQPGRAGMEPEVLELSTSLISAFVNLVERPDVAQWMKIKVLRNDEVRRAGMLKMRGGLAGMLRGQFLAAKGAPRDYPAARVIELLDAKWARILPYLTHAERREFAAQVRGMSGVVPKDEAERLHAFAELLEGKGAPAPLPFVEEFAGEVAQGEAQKQEMLGKAMEGIQAAVRVGEPAGDGWATYQGRDGSFVASFPAPASTSTQTFPGENGGPELSAQMLMYQSPAELKLVVTCLRAEVEAASQPDPLADMRKKYAGQDIQELVVSGRPALRLKQSTSETEADSLFVSRKVGTCVVVGEYPKGTRETAGPLAERFVSSFALTP